MRVTLIKIACFVVLSVLTAAHAKFSTPWLIEHGSSAAFDMMVALWAVMIYLWMMWGFIIHFDRKKR